MSDDYKQLVERAMKLHEDEIIDLLELVGIHYRGRDGGPATHEDLRGTPKDMLLHPLYEADSRVKVENFLRNHGV